jgi:hypothetical protein
MDHGETSAGRATPPDILEERGGGGVGGVRACFHGRALDPALLNLLQLEIKRLNCSPTAPNTTMPDRGLKARQVRHGSGAIWEASEHGKPGACFHGARLGRLAQGLTTLGIWAFLSSPLCRRLHLRGLPKPQVVRWCTALSIQC